MKVYVVIENIGYGEPGAIVHGVYSSEEKADERYEKVGADYVMCFELDSNDGSIN